MKKKATKKRKGPVRFTSDQLGDMAWDELLRWWTTRRVIDGIEVALSLSGPANATATFFSQAADVIERLEPSLPETKAFAARKLLALANGEWLEPGAPRMDRERFIARLGLRSVVLTEGGEVELYLDADGMFTDHSVIVRLDRDLRPRDAHL